MKAKGKGRARRVGHRLSKAACLKTFSLFLFPFSLLLSGCESAHLRAVDLHPPYKPDNIYRAGEKLPDDLKRVAILPLTCDAQETDSSAGRDALEPLLFSELLKAKHFEVVQVSREELRRLTGRQEWSVEEILPANFFSLLEKKYGCDGVLFCQLTEFRAYPPVAVGWRLNLVDVRRKQTLWTSDEQFDAGKPAVLSGARSYQRHDQIVLDDDAGGWLTANSPVRFGQYSLEKLFNTLPMR